MAVFSFFRGRHPKHWLNSNLNYTEQRAEASDTFEDSKYQKLKTKPVLASYIIAIGMKRDEEKRIPEMEEIAAVSCAVQNMYLTATAYGVGCYWSTGGRQPFGMRQSHFFKLGPEDKLLGFLIHWVCPEIRD